VQIDQKVRPLLISADYGAAQTPTSIVMVPRRQSAAAISTRPKPYTFRGQTPVYINAMPFREAPLPQPRPWCQLDTRLNGPPSWGMSRARLCAAYGPANIPRMIGISVVTAAATCQQKKKYASFGGLGAVASGPCWRATAGPMSAKRRPFLEY